MPGAVFANNPQLRGGPPRLVHRDLMWLSLLTDDDGRQQPPPWRQFTFIQGGVDVFICFGRHAERGQNFTQGLCGDILPGSIPALECCTYAVRLSQLPQQPAASAVGRILHVRIAHAS